MANPWDDDPIVLPAPTARPPIDRSRPILENSDGSFSTERTITASFNEDGREVFYNIPTIVSGRDVGEDEAIRLFKQGKNQPVGRFGSLGEAEGAARARSQEIGIVRGADRAGAMPWDNDPIIDDGPGLEIDIVGGTPQSKVDAQQPAQRQQPSGFMRDLGMGARSVIQGAGGLFGALGGDAANYYLIPGEQPTYREAAGNIADRLGLPSPQTSRERVMGDVGEALTGTGLTMGVGGLLGAGRGVASAAAPTVRARTADLLTAQPKLQAVSTATGAGAAGATRESGGSQGAQLLAGLAGGLGPGVASAGTAAATRGAVRGRSGAQMEQNIGNFGALGATPSVGQASGSRMVQGAENLLGGAPTSAGVINRFAERQAEDIGGGLQKMADDFYRNASGERAGRAVLRGVKGEEGIPGFMQNSRGVADKLYEKLDESIPSGMRVGAAGTRASLADLNSAIEGAPSVSRFFQNARIQGIEGALLDDMSGTKAVLTRPGMAERASEMRSQLTAQSDDAATAISEYGQQVRRALEEQARAIAARNAQRRTVSLGGGQPEPEITPQQIDAAVKAATSRLPKPLSAKEIDSEVDNMLSGYVDDRIPYEAVRKLRTLVGNEIENVSLVSDVPRSKWKALYAALSRDMEEAAVTPAAKQALSRANAYYNARVKRIEAIDHVIDRNGGPEKVFSAVMSGAKDGGTTLRAVMQSLPKEGQQAVTAAVIKRMGLANPGVQDAAGETFSAQTFLRKWNDVSPEAKRALFDRHGPGFTRDMDRIASVAQNIRDGAKVYANPSGTANRAAAMTYGMGLIASLFDPSLVSTGGLVVSGAGANYLARKMTDPEVVKWLANATALPVGSAVAQINALRRIGEKKEDEEIVAIADQLEADHRNNKGANPTNNR